MNLRETFNKVLNALKAQTITADEFKEAVNVIGVRDALFSTMVADPEVITAIANLEIDLEDSFSSSTKAVALALDTEINGASWSEVQVRDLVQNALDTDLDDRNSFAGLVNWGIEVHGFETAVQMVKSSFSNLTAEDHLVHAETLAELRK